MPADGAAIPAGGKTAIPERIILKYLLQLSEMAAGRDTLRRCPVTGSPRTG